MLRLVFLGLNRMFNDPFSPEELCALGTELGADIPFCIRKGCVRATGIGEVFEEKYAPFRSDSGDCHRKQGLLHSCGLQSLRQHRLLRLGKRSAPLQSSVSRRSAEICRLLFNAFEEVIFPQNSDAEFLKKELLRLGAWGR